jgi:thioredoxin 1
MNIPMILLITIIGTGTGAALGYFGKCTSGACPLTANPWRGAFVGGLLAAIFAVSSAHANQYRAAESGNDVPHIEGREQFNTQVMKAQKPVLVDFYADWCGPCRSIAPTIAQIHQRYAPGRMKVFKVNVDKNRDLAQEYKVRGIPHLLVFKNGKIIASQTGAIPKNEMIKWVEETLKN